MSNRRSRTSKEWSSKEYLLVSPGYAGASEHRIREAVGDRGILHVLTDTLGYRYYSIETDDAEALREHLKSCKIHSDGSYGSGYW